MNGLMMQPPLLISTLLTHAERHHGEQEIVSRRVEGDIHRTTYGELAARAHRVANVLAQRGVTIKPFVAMTDRAPTCRPRSLDAAAHHAFGLEQLVQALAVEERRWRR